MNIIKIQDQLKSVPDNTLVGYVQNPTGQVPTYLALSELQRRKDMRSKYQAQQPEQKTVAEDLVQETEPGVMGLSQGKAMQLAMQPPPEMPMEQMAQGGLADLDTGNMYDESNYASGGIVAFAKGGDFDNYGIGMPTGATLDDIIMEQAQADKLYGVDPEFYRKQAAELQKQRDELAAEKTQAGWLGIAKGGFEAASAKPEFGKAQSPIADISRGVASGLDYYGKEIKDIKAQDRLLKQADMKLAEAKQAEARGDSRSAIKAMDERNNLLLNAQFKRAELGIKDKIASAKATGDNTKAEALLKVNAAKIGEQKFLNAYPSGAVSGYLGDNQALTEFIRNKYIKNTEHYLRTGELLPPPSEADVKKEFEKLYPNKAPGAKESSNKPASTKPASTKPASTRPTNIQNILNKYPTTGKRTTNTPEELNTPWDLAGQGLEDEED